jgi:hypothetical protein
MSAGNLLVLGVLANVRELARAGYASQDRDARAIGR